MHYYVQYLFKGRNLSKPKNKEAEQAGGGAAVISAWRLKRNNENTTRNIEE
jgi:hypothetical protein